MKSEYLAPTAEIIEIDGDDIIRSSPCGDDCWGDCTGYCFSDCPSYDPNAGINYTGEVCIN